MGVRRLAVVVSTAFTMSMGLISVGASAAVAAPAPSTDIGVQQIRVIGPYRTEYECQVVQNEFRRYYRITTYCRYVPSSGYYFNYDRPE